MFDIFNIIAAFRLPILLQMQSLDCTAVYCVDCVDIHVFDLKGLSIDYKIVEPYQDSRDLIQQESVDIVDTVGVYHLLRFYDKVEKNHY